MIFEELSQAAPAPGFQPVRATESRWASLLMNRYADAYRVARFITLLGKIIKAIGWIAAVVVAVAGVVTLYQTPNKTSADFVRRVGLLVFTALSTGVAWLFYFVLGTLISACGHLLLAVLDQTVNTSPMLNDEQRASAMGL